MTLPSTRPAPAGPAPAAAGRSAVAPTRRRRRGDLSGYAFAAPFVVVFAAFLVWPVLAGAWTSLTDTSLMAPGGFIGFGNYAEAFADPQVWQTLWQTFLFTLITTLPLVLLGLVMALLVHTGLPGQWLWRTSFFASYLLPVAVVTGIWAWMFQADIGLLNSTLASLGLEGVGWLTQEGVAMLSIALVTVWWTAGFNFLLYLAALQSIPASHLEAATLDGAGAWRRIFSVIVPQLRGVTGVILVLQLLASLKVFDQIYLLTAGGPNGSTRPILEYIYDTGFTNYRLGYASAISYIFFAVILIITLMRFLPSRRKEH
ncbi:carbohydrate ABC transporter permease [Litorihabitans aurantiacus]|uniref:Sugar ABC transporter permease n=1 Tax=Litorihabitans aurantiacus TaxID=1930061 RepID=A0AA37XEL2_9MICO|nr:sugar ABC transporter permease [Litorihabitans aurantiacus]GMA31881.1 sugar ABC transporter permease [Litorihabitans aurantiacus]